MIGLLGLISLSAVAQKGELRDAQENYDNYTVSRGSTVSLLVTKAVASLNDAKTAIDKAAANDKTANLPQTYALKGAIYSALASRDSVSATAEPLLSQAKDAIKKVTELDTKGDYKKLIADANTNMAIYYQKLGVKQYQAGQYDQAYKSFDSWNQALPDTTAVYYGALAAGMAGNSNPQYYTYAIKNYKQLLGTNYSANEKIYGFLSSLYLTTKDTTDALNTINEGAQKYPSNANLRELQVQLALQAGKENEILSTLESSVAKDPNNKNLAYYAGLAYSRIGDADDEKASKEKDATAKAKLHKDALDAYSKAADYYKKAVTLDPNYFEANMNLGYVLMKPAIDIYNQARELPANAPQKQYVDLRQKADAQFDVAKPYLQKAVDLNPKSPDALANLWNYYRGKYDPANAAANTTKAADVKKQLDALSAAGNKKQ